MKKSISRHTSIHPQDKLFHTQTDPHRQSRLADIILGGQDGLVNVLGVILGVVAASQNPRIVIAAGLAATFAESVSMGAVAFTSTSAETSHYDSEKAREYRHVEKVPELEKEEIYDIYRKKGFEGELLDKVVDTITSNKDVWVSEMMSNEHDMAPEDSDKHLGTAIIVFASAMIGSLIPLTPFFFLPIGISTALAVVVSALTLYGVGYYKAKQTIGHAGKSGLQMTAIGLISAFVGFAVGWLFRDP